MSRTSAIKGLLAASSIAAMGALMSTTASASVIHTGEIIAGISGGGVGFSSLHKSTNGAGSGSGLGSISGDLLYTWDTSGSGGVFGTGTTLTFDLGSTTIMTKSSKYRVDLWTSSSVLTVGGAFNHGSIDVQPGSGTNTVAVTHDIGGSINFTIEQLTGANNGAILSDTFNFSSTMRMGPINGIGEKDGTFFTFLWGDTGIFDGGCSGTCTEILSTFYDNRPGKHGLGIDIAFSGTPVPEPTSMALAALGLVGVGFARRRRKTA